MKYFRIILIGMVALSLVACSDDSESKKSKIVKPDVEDIEDNKEPTDPGDDPPDDEDNTEWVDPNEDEPYVPPVIVEPDDGWKMLLVPAISPDVEVPYKGAAKLSVMLVSSVGDDAGEGVVGERIEWGVQTGTESLMLSDKSTSTMERGIATVSIKGKGTPGDAIVIASSKNAPKSVSFNVKMLDVPTGTLALSALYNGKAPAVNYVIKLYDGNEVQCAYTDLKLGAITKVDSDGEEASPIADPVDGQVAKFNDLSIENDYTAIAYGFAENGAIVAAGCLDSGLDIHENLTTNGTIYLDTIDLDPVTTYHARSYFDLGNVVASLGTVGYYIDQVAQFARNPAGKVYDILFKLIKEELGAGVFATIVDKILEVSSLKDSLLTKLNSMVTETQMGCQMGLFACQFNNIITQLELMGELSIQKEGSIELKGSNAYNGLAVYWRMKCSNNSDPNCGRFPISTTSVASGINLLEGEWNGALANGYDKISIEPHTLKFSYGKIATLLINDFLLPQITKQKCHDMTCALGQWINADGLASWISDTLSFDINIVIKKWEVRVSKDQARGWVDSALNGVASLLNIGSAMLELQSADSKITISGTAMLKDSNADNVVDVIYDGKWSGSMEVKSKKDGVETVTGTAVRGIWSAYNSKNVVIDDQMYCSQDVTATDSKDQLCHYPEIDLNSFSDSGMCNEYARCAN